MFYQFFFHSTLGVEWNKTSLYIPCIIVCFPPFFRHFLDWIAPNIIAFQRYPLPLYQFHCLLWELHPELVTYLRYVLIKCIQWHNGYFNHSPFNHPEHEIGLHCHCTFSLSCLSPPRAVVSLINPLISCLNVHHFTLNIEAHLTFCCPLPQFREILLDFIIAGSSLASDYYYNS